MHSVGIHFPFKDYGFHSAAAKAKLERLRHILGVSAPPQAAAPEPPLVKCACCGKPMQLIGRLEALPLWRARLSAAHPSRAPPAA